MNNNKLKKGIYIIPVILTCGNIACGYISIIASIDGNFTQAAWLIIIAIAFDMTDGRIARMTNTTSEFGVYLDSLGDSLSFGLAPAIMIYQLVLKPMQKIGIAISCLFVLCSMLRLAKFNLQAHNKDKNIILNNFFIGLPTPASAGVLISFVLSYELFGFNSHNNYLTFKTIPVLMNNIYLFFKIMPIVMIVLSLLMVSNIPYISLKKINLAKPKAFRLLILLVVIVWLMLTFPQNTIFILFSLYTISGILGYTMKYWKFFVKRKKSGK
ncbi:MAG: CDP-diacylglycerol--serine O-phosphatidyltransferase [Endomicrobium sp.]|jgi:CDP-diacylglycerol--serine O-phosphatidyltransferase|nr:CDP-diacylglycerol--serine O-phosphatidyltransferase [Endomicrobium sp.]